jgi:hypothetical protein
MTWLLDIRKTLECLVEFNQLIDRFVSYKRFANKDHFIRMVQFDQLVREISDQSDLLPCSGPASVAHCLAFDLLYQLVQHQIHSTYLPMRMISDSLSKKKYMNYSSYYR